MGNESRQNWCRPPASGPEQKSPEAIGMQQCDVVHLATPQAKAGDKILVTPSIKALTPISELGCSSGKLPCHEPELLSAKSFAKRTNKTTGLQLDQSAASGDIHVQRAHSA